MPNYFDQFDQATAPAPSNYFDQFDQPQEPAWRGSILPLSQDQPGGPKYLDWNSGLPGMAGRMAADTLNAIALPGDVLSGKTSIMGANGQYNPDVINRGIGLAGMMAPLPPGSTAGMLRAAPGPRGIPTTTQLRDAGAGGYDAWRNSGLEYTPSGVANVARRTQSDLLQEGILASDAPRLYAKLDAFGNPPPGSVAVTSAAMHSIRKSLGRVGTDATELEAARIARGNLDSFIAAPGQAGLVAGTATPQSASDLARGFTDANGNYAAARRSNLITGDLDRAATGVEERAELGAAAANSGHNLDNSIRQRVRSLRQNPVAMRGFSQDELDALDNVINGGFVQNRLRNWSNILGGGGGLAHMVTGLAGGAAATHGGEGLLGSMVAGMGLPMVGHAMKAGENALASRALNAADEVIRQNSPLYRAWQAQQPGYSIPWGPSVQQLGTRALMPGLLDYLQNGGLPQAMPQGPGLLPGA